MEKIIIFLFFIYFTLQSNAPFIQTNDIHPTLSQFQFNLILNQNRNKPIIMMQYSEDKTLNKLKPIIENTFLQQKGVSFALLVDCRNFSFNLNKTLNLCQQYTDQKKKKKDDNPDIITDQFFRFQFFTPNPIKIYQKGHQIKKNHDHVDLRKSLGSQSFNSNYLAKYIKSKIPNYVNYLEDQTDFYQFLKTQSFLSLSKAPKLIYIMSNLQIPLFVKKLAINLQGWFQIAATDSTFIQNKLNAKFQQLILLEYDFKSKIYQTKKIIYNQQNQLQTILQHKDILSYTNIRRPRDILLDFEHKQPKIYQVKQLKQINQLLAHGRLILLQISNSQNSFDCSLLNKPAQKYTTLFNYVCYSQKSTDQLLTMMQLNTQISHKNKLFMISRQISNVKIITNIQKIMNQLPKNHGIIKISNQKQAVMCMQAARAAQKQLVFFYYNQNTYGDALNSFKYMSSIQQVNSLLYFCQFYLPDDDIKKTYELNQNTAFTLLPHNKQSHMQKAQHKHLDNFLAVKMFLRQISLNRLIKIYQQKINNNILQQITTSQHLSKNCFGKKCIIALIQTNTFHQDTEVNMLKQFQIKYNNDFKFYWIDGICHFQIAKQLKLIGKTQKVVNKSFIIFYNEKNRQISIFKGSNINKFWQKKQVQRWIKGLKQGKTIEKRKFALDFQDKKCIKNNIKNQQNDNQL